MSDLGWTRRGEGGFASVSQVTFRRLLPTKTHWSICGAVDQVLSILRSVRWSSHQNRCSNYGTVCPSICISIEMTSDLLSLMQGYAWDPNLSHSSPLIRLMQIESPDLIYWWSDTSPWYFDVQVISEFAASHLPFACLTVARSSRLMPYETISPRFLASCLLRFFPLFPHWCVLSIQYLSSYSCLYLSPDSYRSSGSQAQAHILNLISLFFLTLLIAS